MLVLFRKSGQGIAVNNAAGERYEFDFLYNEAPRSHYRINGKEVTQGDMEPFYLDPNGEVMVIVIASGHCPRFGIDAPRHWNIARKEIEPR